MLCFSAEKQASIILEFFNRIGRFQKFVLPKRTTAIGKAAVQKTSINGWSRPEGDSRPLKPIQIIRFQKYQEIGLKLNPNTRIS
jgi:hypothetical protein